MRGVHWTLGSYPGFGRTFHHPSDCPYSKQPRSRHFSWTIRSDLLETVQTFYPEHGEIYDRNGHLLAGNKTVYEIGVDLKSIKDKHAIALAVGMELGLNPDNLYSLMANPPSNLNISSLQIM